MRYSFYMSLLPCTTKQARSLSTFGGLIAIIIRPLSMLTPWKMLRMGMNANDFLANRSSI